MSKDRTRSATDPYGFLLVHVVATMNDFEDRVEGRRGEDRSRMKNKWIRREKNEKMGDEEDEEGDDAAEKDEESQPSHKILNLF